MSENQDARIDVRHHVLSEEYSLFFGYIKSMEVRMTLRITSGLPG